MRVIATRFEYVYEDSNGERETDFVHAWGAINEAQRKALNLCLLRGSFLPTQIGWEHPGRHFFSFPTNADHAWCMLDTEAGVRVHQMPPGAIVKTSVDEVVAAFRSAVIAGWDERVASCRLGLPQGLELSR